MNILLRNESQFCLLRVSMTADDCFCVSAIYILPDGSLNHTGIREEFKMKHEAVKRIDKFIKVKGKKKGYEEVEVAELPEKAEHFLAPDLESYLSEQGMWEFLEETKREHYVEFFDLTGMEGHFDIGMEYLAIADDEKGFYHVYDKFGEKMLCNDLRMSRCELTERAKKVLALQGEEYSCPECRDSTYGCAHCTS